MPQSLVARPVGRYKLLLALGRTNFTARFSTIFGTMRWMPTIGLLIATSYKDHRYVRMILAGSSVVQYCYRASVKAVGNRGITGATELSFSFRMRDCGCASHKLHQMLKSLQLACARVRFHRSSHSWMPLRYRMVLSSRMNWHCFQPATRILQH